jgi:hypothetical protein
VRPVAIPPHLLPVVETHLAEDVSADADALLFPAGHGGSRSHPSPGLAGAEALSIDLGFDA